MRIALALAGMILLAAPAAAVTVSSVSASGGNSATIVTQAPGLLEADFAFAASSPIRLGLTSDAGERDFAFNSAVEFFTGAAARRNMRSLTVSLDGAIFTGLGAVAPTFAGYTAWLSPDAAFLRIGFTSPGEPNAVLLGSLAGGDDFMLRFAGGDTATLTLRAVVPEPGTWALLIAGFGLVGVALRRGTRVPA
jgi:hypothetical protein